MARGGADREPYDAALQLAGWAVTNLAYLRGALIRKGVRPETLTARDWLDVALSAVVDGVGIVDRQKVLERMRERLATSVFADEETFGTDPASIRATRAMMDLAGGAAPMRDPSKPRPAAWDETRPAAEEDPPDHDRDRRGLHRGSA